MLPILWRWFKCKKAEMQEKQRVIENVAHYLTTLHAKDYEETKKYVQRSWLKRHPGKEADERLAVAREKALITSDSVGFDIKLLRFESETLAIISARFIADNRRLVEKLIWVEKEKTPNNQDLWCVIPNTWF